MKAKRAKTARVYPAESDPRQAKIAAALNMMVSTALETLDGIAFDVLSDSTAALAYKYGPWVRGADGRWQRDRRKRAK